MKNRLAYYLDDFYTLNKGKNKQDFFMQTFLPLKRSLSHLHTNLQIFQNLQKASSQVLQKIYIFAVDNMEERRVPNSLVSFFPKQTDYIFLPFYCYLTNVYCWKKEKMLMCHVIQCLVLFSEYILRFLAQKTSNTFVLVRSDICKSLC